MVGLVVTVLLYVVAAVPGFFAINDPTQQNARTAVPPAREHPLIDRRTAPGVGPAFHPEKLTRDPETLAAIYKPDTEDPVPPGALRPGLRLHASSACSRPTAT